VDVWAQAAEEREAAIQPAEEEVESLRERLQGERLQLAEDQRVLASRAEQHRAEVSAWLTSPFAWQSWCH
jgi:dsDNA-specific endonuclease/ATPase MutS2